MVTRQRRAMICVLVGIILSAAPARADWDAAVAAYRAQEWRTAAAELEMVLKKTPGYAPGHYLLGLVHLKLGEAGAGLAELRRAVELDPPNAEYSLGLVQSLVAAGQPAEAFTVADGIPAKGLSPARRSTLALLLARAALKLDDPGRALPVVQDALEATPDAPALYHALGSLLEASDDLQGAFGAYRKAFELDPDHQRAAGARSLYLVRVLASRAIDTTGRTERYRRALPVARQLAGGSRDPAVLRSAGLVALGAGEAKTAAAWLGAAAEAKPGEPGLAYDLGRALASSGDESGAYAAFTIALKSFPEAGLARRVHIQMARIDAHRLDIDAAARHFRAAGDATRADELTATGKGLAEAGILRGRILARIHELQGARTRLRELGDANGVAATTREIEVQRKKLQAIERNLADVRAGLKRL